MLNLQSAPPPVHSKPEASNFPSQTYYMSEETKLFTPPAKYPDPPKDMYYEVPEKAPAPPKPKQIFPWESHARKATRVFPAEPPEPQPQPEPEPEPAATTTTTTLTPPPWPRSPHPQIKKDLHHQWQLSGRHTETRGMKCPKLNDMCKLSHNTGVVRCRFCIRQHERAEASDVRA